MWEYINSSFIFSSSLFLANWVIFASTMYIQVFANKKNRDNKVFWEALKFFISTVKPLKSNNIFQGIHIATNKHGHIQSYTNITHSEITKWKVAPAKAKNIAPPDRKFILLVYLHLKMMGLKIKYMRKHAKIMEYATSIILSLIFLLLDVW